MTYPPTPRAIIPLLLLAALFIGIAQAALLPPFEGIDEAAHYSYIQQLADTGRWTSRGDNLSTDIDDYVKVAPTGMDKAQPYARFFSGGPEAIEAGRIAAHAPPLQPRAWRPGTVFNWQAQHPPLYYLAMTPIYRASNDWSLANQILLIRIFSYGLAWAALVLAAFTALRASGVTGFQLPLAIALWPALFPMWFPEMARVGNDSLIIFIVSLIVVTMVSLQTSGSIARYVVLAILVGLGLLTKAILIPVAAAASLLLMVQLASARADVALFRKRLIGVSAFFCVTAAICGWWYVLKLIETGNLIGSHDIVQMQAAGGMIAGLKKHFQLVDLARAPWGWMMTFVWGSTLSFVAPPRIAMILLAASTIAVGLGCYRTLRARPVSPQEWFGLLTLALFLASIVYHTAVVLSFDNGVSPMWYAHAFAPILAPLVAAGLVGLASLRHGRGIIAVVIGYPLAFLALATAINAFYFSGCGSTQPGRVYFLISSARPCLSNLAAVYDNLSVLGFPRVASALFIVGWLIYGAAAALAIRHLSVDARIKLAGSQVRDSR